MSCVEALQAEIVFFALMPELSFSFPAMPQLNILKVPNMDKSKNKALEKMFSNQGKM